MISDFAIASKKILTLIPNRVVLATIRNLAKCPSPTTLIQKQYIPALGTKADEQRHQHICIDDSHRRDDVDLARKLIFEKGLGIKSTKVEGLLQSKSYTPTRVWIYLFICSLYALTVVLLERLFPSTLPIQLQFLLLVCPRSFA